MTSISPADFFRTFSDECKRQESELATRWYSAPVYTEFIRDVLFRKIAKTLEVEYHGADFLALDAIMYCEKDLDNFPENMTYPYSICVALEHENVPARSMEEINKLQFFNTSLKVLVTYPDRQNTAELLLRRYGRAIQRADLFQEFSTLQRQLVIFGSKTDVYPVWTGHVYENGGFSTLKL